MDEEVIAAVRRGHNVLILGQAGTGKSFLLEKIYKTMHTEKSTQTLATTGIASSSLPQGRTVHSYFGLMDGRFSTPQLIQRITQDDNYNHIKSDVCNIELLLIDEVSMLSKKTIEQVDDLCRHVRGKADVPFGNIQVVLFGDLYQLPPVPNYMYDDIGEPFITSNRFSFHTYQLSDVHRQTEECISGMLIRAVNELSRGEVSDDTEAFLQTLKRDIPPGTQPTKLFALNYDVDLYNSDQLLHMDGEVTTYESSDSGDVRRLSRLSIPKTLHFKVNTPVMLQVNITRTLVNGLCGTVTSLGTDTVTVYFPSVDKSETIQKFNFTVFDRERGKDVACRTQIPLKLAFAYTVHKAQGLTIERLCVDCRHMTNPGQIGVAIGRATSIVNLQVLNFKKKCVKKHRKEIQDFYSATCVLPFVEDWSCCRGHTVLLEGKQSEVKVSRYEDEFGQYDSEESEHEHELQAVMDGEEQLEALQQAEGNEQPMFSCPDDLNFDTMLSSLKYDDPVTQPQHDLNSNLTTLNLSMERTTVFGNKIWNKFYSLFINIVPQNENLLQNKHITELYKEITLFLQSTEYLDMVKILFSTDVPNPHQTRTAFSIVEYMRAFLLTKASEPYFQKARESAQDKMVTEQSKGSKSKIRYLGGWCLATIRYRKKCYVKRNLYKKRKKIDVEKVDKIVRCIDMLTEDAEVLLQTSEDKSSLEEVQRKQNVRGGLTNISDDAMFFFQALDKRVQELETRENLHVHTKSFYQFIFNEVMNSKELLEKWKSLFCNHDDEGVVVCDSEMITLLEEVVMKYLKMSSSQFRMEYKRNLQVQKEEAHRKNIRIRKEKQTARQFTFQSIIDDTSINKIKSHLRLQSELTGNSKFLMNFTKDQLRAVCSAYNLKTNQNMNKSMLCDLISAHVPSSNGMNYSEKISEKSQESASGSAGSRKRVSVGKGKGKAKARKGSCNNPCGICEKKCDVDCVCCDICDKWFHFTCLQMSGEEEELQGEGAWYCQNCLPVS